MATSEETPYQILNVPENIDYGPLRRIYRNKIHEHKQKKISPIGFRRICRAYETISDFDKRKHYDSTKEWTSNQPLDQYTPQQLAAEPDLIRDLKERLNKFNLTQLNAQDPHTGHTTLYTASRAGNVAAVDFLTKQGADPDLSQRTKSTALHAASFFGHADVVRSLLESGANYTIVNSCNNTPEAEAYTDEVKKIFIELKQNAYVRAAANELDWFKTNGLKKHQDTEFFSHRQTLLHCASKKGYFELVKWLVKERSANIDLVDFNGNSALHLAAFGGYNEIVKYLLDLGCDSTLRNVWGTTAENEGTKHGNKITDIFKSMHERDMFEMAQKGVAWWFYYYFDVNSKDKIDSNGRSLLYYACSYGSYDVTKWLLERGANINIQMSIYPNSTPLHGAKYRGHWKIVELLLEYGADVNIKNGYGKNVFDEKFNEEVDKVSSAKTNEILQHYEHKLKDENVLDIWLYDEDEKATYPISKLFLPITSTYQDLLEEMRRHSNNECLYFSIAGRVVKFPNEKKTTIISAVGRTRYTSSKFIDTPIHLVCHKQKPKEYENYQPIREDPAINLADFNEKFDACMQTFRFDLKAPFVEEQNMNINNLMFTFPKDCVQSNIELTVQAVFAPDFQTFGISGCICLFKMQLPRTHVTLDKLPIVCMENEQNARLYTLASSSSYWFGSKTRQNHLPMIGGFHALIRHVNIIPNHLCLPPDMFLAASLEQPLISQNRPVPCKCLVIRKHDPSIFPHIAYHGTNINAIHSILHDGLVLPGTLVSGGRFIEIPKNHISRDVLVYNVPDYATSIFVSPSVYYSSNSTYGQLFISGDQQLIPVLKCSVKKQSFTAYHSTTPSYTPKPNEDEKSLEWRISDPTNVEINAVLFVIKNASIRESAGERYCRMS